IGRHRTAQTKDLRGEETRPGPCYQSRFYSEYRTSFPSIQGFPVTPASSGQEGQFMKRPIGLVLALLLGAVPMLWAQASTGNIYGSVADASGAVLPGASVTISGANIGAHTTQSGPQGDFRFLNLDPGTYKLTVSMTGFANATRDVVVTTGQIGRAS